MASTYSALKIELIGTGEQSGTWGTTTNTNLGDAALGEAITGSADVNFATDADVTITLTDTNATQSARNLRLNITESSTGIGSVRNLILGSGCQIEKFYLINNTGTGAKTVKNTTGTGISVPAGKATLVFNNGTNVVDAATYLSSLTLGSALPVASGGTGSTSTTFVNLASNVTGTLPIANGGTGATTNAGTAYALKGANSDITSITGLTTALTVAQGGTGVATLTTAYGVLAAGTTATGALQNIGVGTSGQVLKSNGAGVLPSFQAAGGGGFSNMTVYTSPGTFTTPATTTQIKVTVVGGGGGGGSAPAPGGSGAGGGGGGCAIYVGPVTASTPYAVTVGAAVGAATAGNTSSFGPLASATGGSAGQNGQGPTTATSSTSGGAGSAGTLQFTGGVGGFNTTGTSAVANGGIGGTSFFGGGGRSIRATTGAAGGNYGSGGGGGGTYTFSGGGGAAGVVVVEY